MSTTNMNIAQKKIVSVIAALFIALAIFAGMSVPADAATSAPWDGSIDVEWYNGHENDTIYEIGTAEELAGLAAIVNGQVDTSDTDVTGDFEPIENANGNYWQGIDDMKGKTIRLTNDIDMGGTQEQNFMPIGGQWQTADGRGLSTSFNGTLDGAGHMVKNISCVRYQPHPDYYKDQQSIGLVGRLGVDDNDPASWRADSPTVKNVGISGYIKGNRSIGGIVGKIGQSNNGGKVEKCVNYATVIGTDAKGTGGIVGAAWNDGTITDCYNMGNVTNTSTPKAQMAGGIAGSNEAVATNCYNKGTVSAGGTTYALALGTNNTKFNLGTFQNCYWLDTSAPAGIFNPNGDQASAKTAAQMTDGSFAVTMGTSYAEDTNGINGGYPILQWQQGRTAAH